MLRRPSLSLLCISALVAPSALGQVTAPVPEKPKPTPEWTPPPKAPPVKPKDDVVPNPDEVPAKVSVLVRDEAGNIQYLSDPANEVAALKVADSASIQRREATRAVVALRKTQVQQVLSRLADNAFQVRSGVKALGTSPANATDEQHDAVKTALDVLVMRFDLVEQLRQKDALSKPQLVKVNEAVAEYQREINKAARAKFPPNDADGIKKVARWHATRSNTLEAIRELNVLLVRVAERWDKVKPALAMTAAQAKLIADAEAKVAEASTPAEKADAMAVVLEQLSGQQRKVALTAVTDELPEGEKAETFRGK
ncbi:MAG: hypothetical protein ACKVS8_04560 [Phycisphaerales bacterium]